MLGSTPQQTNDLFDWFKYLFRLMYTCLHAELSKIDRKTGPKTSDFRSCPTLDHFTLITYINQGRTDCDYINRQYMNLSICFAKMFNVSLFMLTNVFGILSFVLTCGYVEIVIKMFLFHSHTSTDVLWRYLC